ncbi:MAG: hypothetical protein H7838_11265 [Magnetococcus sp. DMHC-8]
MTTQPAINLLPTATGRSTGRTIPKRRRERRIGHELSKTGMIASLTVIALTGFRILKPMLPVHPIAGLAFIGFALWHVYQKDQRTVLVTEQSEQDSHSR